jgi:hypothetical protein
VAGSQRHTLHLTDTGQQRLFRESQVAHELFGTAVGDQGGDGDQ